MPIRKTILKKALLAAGSQIKKHFRKRETVRYKKHREIVSKADIEADKIIRDIITANFPKDDILSEEGRPTRNGSEWLWIIDPLDGTTNFTRGNPFYTVNIALAKEGTLVLSGIFAPSLDELYLAELGGGARRNGKRISVSRIKTLNNAFAIYGHGYADQEKQDGTHIYSKTHAKIRYGRMFGSAGIETAAIASGSADALMYSSTRVWDIAAGALLIEEAGGKITDLDGKHWTPQMPLELIISTNGILHEATLAAVKHALKSR